MDKIFNNYEDIEAEINADRLRLENAERWENCVECNFADDAYGNIPNDMQSELSDDNKSN